MQKQIETTRPSRKKGVETVLLSQVGTEPSAAHNTSPEEWMRADGLDPLHYLTDPTHGGVPMNAGELRKLGFRVGWDPDDAPKHHGAV
jgi:hypothetical protein